jgi:hypothetical protein
MSKIIKCKIIRFRGDDRFTENGEKEVTSSWYTAQSYFNEYLKDDFLSSDFDKINLHWRGRCYEFVKRK